MSLASDLEQFGANLPDNQLPSIASVRPVLGALVLAVEHGEEFVRKYKDDPEGLLAAIAEKETQAAEKEASGEEESSPISTEASVSLSPANEPETLDTSSLSAEAELEAQKKDDPVLALKAENEDLRQQVQNLVAQFQRTQVAESESVIK